MEYTSEHAAIFRDVVINKWRWFQRTGRLDGVNDKGRSSLFDRAVKETWFFLSGSSGDIPAAFLTAAIRQISWHEPSMNTVTTLPEAVETLDEETKEKTDE